MSVACFECGKFPEKTKSKVRGQSNIAFFKKCGGCGVPAYCSVACQRASWKTGHKTHCGLYKDALGLLTTLDAELVTPWKKEGSIGEDVLPSKAMVQKLRYKRYEKYLKIIDQFVPIVKTRAEKVLQNELIKVFQMKPICDACLAPSSSNGEPLILCDICFWNPLCVRHCESGRHKSSECAVFQEVKRVEAFRWETHKHNDGLGYHLAPEPHQNYKRSDCPKDWDAFFEWRTPPFLKLRPECKVAGTKNLSQPLTALFAMNYFGMWKRIKEGKQKDLVIHVVGAADYETPLTRHWEEIFHSIPELKSLSMAFIGPDITITDRVVDFGAIPTCPDCQKQGKSRLQAFYRCSIEQFWDRYARDLPTPHLIVMFNTGISDGIFGSPWRRALRLLVKTKVPMCLTSYNREEALSDSLLMTHLGARISLLPQKNPFSSLEPCIEFADAEPFYYTNGYVFCLGDSSK
eukprot:Nk52_evm4s241 gene=Nk52_evmTU4s241